MTLAVDEVRLSKDRQTLTLCRRDARADVSAQALRRACRCAACVRMRHDGAAPAVPPGIAITRIDAMGASAANIHFSDGHARGVFPWDYLWQISSSSTDAA